MYIVKLTLVQIQYLHLHPISDLINFIVFLFIYKLRIIVSQKLLLT